MPQSPLPIADAFATGDRQRVQNRCPRLDRGRVAEPDVRAAAHAEPGSREERAQVRELGCGQMTGVHHRNIEPGFCQCTHPVGDLAHRLGACRPIYRQMQGESLRPRAAKRFAHSTEFALGHTLTTQRAATVDHHAVPGRFPHCLDGRGVAYDPIRQLHPRRGGQKRLKQDYVVRKVFEYADGPVGGTDRELVDSA